MPSDVSVQTPTYSQRSVRWGGFAFGILVSLVLAGLVNVAFTGEGLSRQSPPPAQVYFP